MFTLKSNRSSISFNNENGNIVSLKYGAKEFIGGETPLFDIKLLDKSGDAHILSSEDFTLTDTRLENAEISLTFEKEDMRVIANAKVGEQITFGITVSALDGFVTEWVNYPGIAVPDSLSDKGGDAKILWGFNEGSLIESMEVRQKSWFCYKEIEYPSIGLHSLFPGCIETQFMAYYDGEAGIYTASHDNECNLKGIDFYHRGGGIALSFKHFTGSDFGCAYTLPYPQVVQFFEGNWQDACEIYRAWFEENHASDFVKIKDNPHIPRWYKESPVIITYPVRGKFDTDVMTPNKLFPYINVMPHVERFEKELGSKVMILLMHWEGTAPWAPPIVWPPYGGEEKLRELIDALHERGDVLGVYCSGLGWTINSKLDDYNTEKLFEEKGLSKEMCLSPKGELPYSKICTSQRTGYDMCPVRDFTKSTVKGEVQAMASAGIDYVQLMDQNHGGTSYLCYSREHGHPPVPGFWQVKAVKELLSEAKEGYDKLLLGCESAAGESYIPQLGFSDNRFELTYAHGKPVPVYSYIYHQYVNNFMGNQVCADSFIVPSDFPESYYERLAYGFCAGDLLTLIINEDGEIDRSWGKNRSIDFTPDQSATLKFVATLNYFRRNYPEYLHTGKMVKGLKINGRLIDMPRRNNGVCTVPAVHTAAYESDDGSVAEMLVNWQSVEEIVTAELSEGYILIDSEGKETRLDSGKINIQIPAYSAVMVEKK